MPTLEMPLPIELPQWLTDPYSAEPSSNLPPEGTYRMYALTFDLDTEMLRKSYPNEHSTNAYKDIRKILEQENFTWKQGSVYFGDPVKVNLTSCILAAKRLAKELPWFLSSVRDLRMLRIEEQNDVLPIIMP
jgi:virulence-associated protein VapD